MTLSREESRERLQKLLRELFQFDAADLDFGIYRILNQRRDEIERFIKEDLLDAVEEGLDIMTEHDRIQLQHDVDQKREALVEALGEDSLTADGDVVDEHRDTPVAEDYLEAREKLDEIEASEEAEARVLNDLYRFFSRYYEGGDFHSKRRYSSQGPKFYIPYNGEEVKLHWANHDQYFIKTSERFTTYRFEAGDYTVEFRVQEAQVPQDNAKGEDRHFILASDASVSHDPDVRELTVRFEYRPITEDEEEAFIETYNEAADDSLKSFQKKRTIIPKALEAWILEHVKAKPLRSTLESAEEGEDPLLLKHLKRYTASNEMDYFIHKDLRGFLRRELDFFIKNEVVKVDNLLQPAGDSEPASVVRGRVVKEIAERIIDFVEQIEEFQKRLFEKKKFVTQTDYMVTVDQVPEELYDEILDNGQQIEQWKDVYAIDEWEQDLLWNGDFDRAFLENHPHMMIDTAFFDEEFKAELLAPFDDIDGSVDGVLVHGENFQALNLLGEKYEGQVKCSYIDPPYNTGRRDFPYKDNYRHSSWLSMMQDRLELGRSMLLDEGAIFVNIDHVEQARLRSLMESIFGPQNAVAQIAWQKRYTRSNNTNDFTSVIDYLLAYRRSESFSECLFPRDDEADERYTNPDNDPRGPWKAIPFTNPRPARERPNLCYPISNPNTGEVTTPSGDQKAWRRSEEEFQKYVEEDRVWWGKDGTSRIPDIKRFLSEVRDGMTPINLWDYEFASHTDAATKELKDLFEYATYDTPKPTLLVQRVIQVTARDDPQAIILDFFAGSGTVAQAVMELNRDEDAARKYLLMELGEWFDSLLRPRVQKVAFSDTWTEGVPDAGQGMGQFVKYHRIESYEDTLNNIVFKKPAGEQRQITEEQATDYTSGYMIDVEAQGESLLSEEAFEDPFNYKLDIQPPSGTSPQPTTVDLVETFHYLIGAKVRTYRRVEHQGRPYVVTRCEVRTDTGTENVLTVWRRTEDLDLEKEAEWFDDQIHDDTIDRVYVNGESFIKRSEPLEITFRERMEADPVVS